MNPLCRLARSKAAARAIGLSFAAAYYKVRADIAVSRGSAQIPIATAAPSTAAAIGALTCGEA